MCTPVLICHGDKLNNSEIYSPQQVQWWQQNHPGADMSAPAKFYITNDGKYAIDADFVTPAQVTQNFNVANKPKVSLE